MVSPSDSARSEAQSPGTPSAVPSGAVRLAALSETELVYYLSILRYVAREAGSAMCRHREKLMVVLDAALLVEERPGVRSRKVSKAAMHLLRVLLNALVSFRPLESRSVPEYLWRDPAWRRTHYRSWGRVIALADLGTCFSTSLLPLLLASAALAIAALAVLLRRRTKHRPEASPPPQPKEAAPAAPPATPTEEAAATPTEEAPSTTMEEASATEEAPLESLPPVVA